MNRLNYFLQYIICVIGVAIGFSFLDFIFGNEKTFSATDVRIIGFALVWSLSKERQRINEEKAKNLEQAIRETIEDNLHLADGDVCTLIKLKRAIGYR